MVCDMQTQLLQGERNGVTGGLRLTVIQADHNRPFWRCEVRGDYVAVDCGHGLSPVSSRTALKLLLQELMLRSALCDDALSVSSPSARLGRYANNTATKGNDYSAVCL